MASAAANRVAFVEQDFVSPLNDTAGVLARVSASVSLHGGPAFQRLSLVAWPGDLAPTEAAPLPPADAAVAAFLRGARANATGNGGIKVWGSASLCPGPEYACMLNYSLADIAGAQLAREAQAAGLDGVQIWVSPYCNNADCKRTTGKYAVGIARIVAAFRAGFPGGEIALFLNEWDNPQLVAAAQPTAIFSYQTVFYFTSVADCVSQCGALCGAGESSAYVVKDGKNFTAILSTLSADKVAWVGQLRGGSTPPEQNPPDFWPALEAYSAGALANAEPGAPRPQPQPPTGAPAATPLSFLALGDWGGGPLWWQNYTTGPEHLVAASMGRMAAAAGSSFSLALGDNIYPLGLCNNETLAPYNNSCANASSPLAGTDLDPRLQLTFEDVFTSSALAALPFFVIAGNHDALGNVSASIAYTERSARWKHPDYYYRVSYPTNAGPAGETVDVLMVDSTLCYGIWSDPVHDAMCAAQLAWLEAELNASTAAYLFVAAHYPVWSACAHGNTDWAIQVLLPLMLAANATGYLSGHDHCMEHIVPDRADRASGGGLVFVVSGAGDGCCYNESNIENVPAGSLRYLLSQGVNPTNASGGFTSFAFAPQGGSGSSLSIAYHRGDDGALLFTADPVLPRSAVRGADGRVAAMLRP